MSPAVATMTANEPGKGARFGGIGVTIGRPVNRSLIYQLKASSALGSKPSGKAAFRLYRYPFTGVAGFALLRFDLAYHFIFDIVDDVKQP